MKKVAVIGAGISGLSVARALTEQGNIVTVYERETKPGGLIACRNVNDCVFHTCGGHVFNTKNKLVEKWFWAHFDRDREFTFTMRNSSIFFHRYGNIGYPIENHVYQLGDDVLSRFLNDIKQLIGQSFKADNFADFLWHQFGQTLYNLYFKPYNEKIWNCDLADIPLSWLDGKLPIQSYNDMIMANFNHVEESSFVHSHFWYPTESGSQFIANRLASGLNILYNQDINKIVILPQNRLLINGATYDAAVFCGNIKQLPQMLNGAILAGFSEKISKLQSHGTTVAFCSIDSNPYSWIYLPDNQYAAHRIICTGNFAKAKATTNTSSGSIEFTDRIERDAIEHQLDSMPLHPKLLDYKYNEFSYPIQHADTRQLIAATKAKLKQHNIHLVGRFAEWEYFNMDAAIASALEVSI